MEFGCGISTFGEEDLLLMLLFYFGEAQLLKSVFSNLQDCIKNNIILMCSDFLIDCYKTARESCNM